MCTVGLEEESICYMHECHTKDTGYCPDHYNRTIGNKKNGKLSDWIKKHNEELNFLEN